MKISEIALLLAVSVAATKTEAAAAALPMKFHDDAEPLVLAQVTFEDLQHAAAAAAAPRASGSDVSKSSEANINKAMETTMGAALYDVGLVSITHVPRLHDTKVRMWRAWQACNNDNENAVAAITTMHQVYQDGTELRRRTLATATDHGVMHDLLDKAASLSCPDFAHYSTLFRQHVASVLDIVAQVLGTTLVDLPAVSTPQQDGKALSVVDMLQQGQHLEHFHVYEQLQTSSSSNAVMTLDWHVDQGMMLLFAPGGTLMRDDDASSSWQPTDGFYVQTRDGQARPVAFDVHDDLVLMLGDGVHQVWPPATAQHELRAVPHALQIQSSTVAMPRFWYGRMVLPPAQALQPGTNVSFGALRAALLANNNDNVHGSGLGCSSPQQIARVLHDGVDHGNLLDCTVDSGNEALNCTENEHFCWHQCMNFTYYNVSHDDCDSRELSMGCVDPQGLLWNCDHDATMSLGCVNLSTAEIKPTSVSEETPSSNAAVMMTSTGGSNILVAMFIASAMLW